MSSGHRSKNFCCFLLGRNEEGSSKVHSRVSSMPEEQVSDLVPSRSSTALAYPTQVWSNISMDVIAGLPKLR